jgi:hypothetical protein
MNAAHEPTVRHPRLAVLALAVAGTAGVAAGWFMVSGSTPAADYVLAFARTALFGAVCVVGYRQRAPAARWMPWLLMAMFVLDILEGPHIMLLSTLGLGVGAMAIVATLRGRHRVAIASMVACCALLAATLVGGLARR